jgi:dCTP deaminase
MTMIINGSSLLDKQPIKGMVDEKIRLHGVSSGLGEAGYDIRIKQEIVFTTTVGGNRLIEVNDTEGEILATTLGRFVKASAIEEFQVPKDLTGVVHDKSTWAREGLSVFNTVIEPGWNGFLTLELVYHGEGVLRIPAGAGIAQVLFSRVIEPAQYSGKYQHQDDRPVDAIHEH